MKLLGHYGADDVLRLLEQHGILATLEGKGFRCFRAEIDQGASALPRVQLRAEKDGHPCLLLDARITRAEVKPAFFQKHGFSVSRPIELALLYWVREQDPTADFTTERPALPLQRHPGLGILRRAFRVIIAMAREQGLDGVACVPKLYHDAVLFYRSRLFLFLDGGEQGRFEALLRDLEGLALATASLALIGGAVRTAQGSVVTWTPGFEVMPLSAELRAYFHSPAYSSHLQRYADLCRFHVDEGALARVQQEVAKLPPTGRWSQRPESQAGSLA